MGSVDCSYTLARQLQIHLDSEKRQFMTPWKWLSNRTKRRDRESSVVLISNGMTPGLSKFPVDGDFHQTKLIDADLNPMVPLPYGIDLNEWYATQTIFLFDCINMLFGCLFEFCTAATCPTMSGPANIQYYWSDEKGKKSKLSAPQYIDLVTSYANTCIKDETTFPTKYGNVFPLTYQQTVKNIHRLLCHVLVHMQHAHISHLKFLDLSAHYTTVLQHFLLFNRTFSLANPTDLALFDGIYDFLKAPSVVPAIRDSSSPSDSPCAAARVCSDGESSSSPSKRQAGPSSPSQTVMSREDAKSQPDPVDKYVPVFTIVT